MDVYTNSSNDTQQERLQFIGSGSEYFKIWIVNLLLSIVTLGIYSAWAKVRRERYFHNHVLLDGSPFEYHGNPIAILKGRALVFALVLAAQILPKFSPMAGAIASLTFVLFMPWIVVMGFRFKACNSSWRGIRFHFDGAVKDAYILAFGWGILTVLTLGLAMPAAVRRWQQFILNNLRFGHARFRTQATLSTYYKSYAIILALFFAIVILMVFFSPNFEPRSMTPSQIKEFLVYVFGMVILFYFFLPLILVAIVNVKIRNHLFNHSYLEEHRLVSDLQVGAMLAICIKGVFLTVLTLGLYMPAFKVALARYRSEHTAIELNGPLASFIATQNEYVASYGEQAADLFDFDLSL